MRLALGLLLLLAPLGDENPLIPQYPFTSAKITYKKTPFMGAVAWIDGSRQGCRTTLYRKGEVQSEKTVFTDGTHLYEVESRGGRSEAKKRLHLGAYLRADFAGLDETSKTAFLQKREELWNTWSPVFGVDWLKDKVQIELPKVEKICGRDCQVIAVKGLPMALTYWRWKGTDIVLKIEGGGRTLEAEGVEEDVPVPADLFQPPPDAQEDPVEARFDQDLAKEVFKRLCGRDARANPSAVAAPPTTIKLDGQSVTLSSFRFNAMTGDEGMLEITAEGQPWSFHLVAAINVQNLQELTGKSFPLTEDGNEASLQGENVHYAAKNATLKIVSASEKALVASISGSWMRYESQDEGDDKVSDAKVEPFQITASGE
ncbi:MAG: hypothetical protein HYY16_03385 [Planctomycetes bacterium]|nr:hypothetical protein [Planctomycetota bacterium]